MKSIIILILFILICQSVGIIGATFTMSSLDNWYRTIQKPSWNPPDWIFGPVWTTLYAIMGFSMWTIWKNRATQKISWCIIIFIIQLLLNGIWTPLFFGLKNPALALIDIMFLFSAIIATIIIFYKVNRLASLILIPYLLWVGFATILNYHLWKLNC